MKKLKAIFCVLFRHSNIITTCFGYVSCARCGVQLGDTLAGAYSNSRAVIVGHNCKDCKRNYKRLTWVDKFLIPNPLKKEKK